MKFEKAIKRLEFLVDRLEQGELSLEESLKAFEEGIVLSKSCINILNEVEKRVDVLVKSSDGEEQFEPFTGGDYPVNLEVENPSACLLPKKKSKPENAG